jgi:hypothetical protein
LEHQKNRGKEKENHHLFVRAKGIVVKGDEGETNRRDVEVDCHYLEKDGDAAGDSRLPLGKVLAGWGRTVVHRGHHRRERMLKVEVVQMDVVTVHMIIKGLCRWFDGKQS